MCTDVRDGGRDVCDERAGRARTQRAESGESMQSCDGVRGREQEGRGERGCGGADGDDGGRAARRADCVARGGARTAKTWEGSARRGLKGTREGRGGSPAEEGRWIWHGRARKGGVGGEVHWCCVDGWVGVEIGGIDWVRLFEWE